ncbi:hypothetical protein AB0J83_20975 [Actinoplanes sp. NPDC049596]|uniref:hypothetical protein n=1 Tax=unclassified Actinoplanes TaxID=2626549 RepID=UPI003441D79A
MALRGTSQPPGTGPGTDWPGSRAGRCAKRTTCRVSSALIIRDVANIASGKMISTLAVAAVAIGITSDERDRVYFNPLVAQSWLAGEATVSSRCGEQRHGPAVVRMTATR